jgi:hypothetical protein
MGNNVKVCSATLNHRDGMVSSAHRGDGEQYRRRCQTTIAGAEINAAGRSAAGCVITPATLLRSLCAAQIMSVSPARRVSSASSASQPRRAAALVSIRRMLNLSIRFEFVSNLRRAVRAALSARARSIRSRRRCARPARGGQLGQSRAIPNTQRRSAIHAAARVAEATLPITVCTKGSRSTAPNRELGAGCRAAGTANTTTPPAPVPPVVRAAPAGTAEPDGCT